MMREQGRPLRGFDGLDSRRRRVAAATDEAVAPVALAAALALHLLLAIALILLPPPSIVRSAPEGGIEVEILSADALTALTHPQLAVPEAEPPAARAAASPAATAAVAPPPGQVSPGAAVPVPVRPALIHADHLLSERTLSSPLSRGTRRALAQLAADERAEQLCGIEAMDQIELWQRALKPDRLVAYAMADTQQAGDTLIADGAAFRSGGQWYNLSFRCTLTQGGTRIADFAFLVGTPVPRREWEGHGLPAVH